MIGESLECGDFQQACGVLSNLSGRRHELRSVLSDLGVYDEDEISAIPIVGVPSGFSPGVDGGPLGGPELYAAGPDYVNAVARHPSDGTASEMQKAQEPRQPSAAGASSDGRTEASRKKRPARRQRYPKHAQKDAAQAREDAITEAIRRMARENKNVTSKALSEYLTGSDGKTIPEGTIRNTKAWKDRDKTKKEVGSVGNPYRHTDCYSSDQSPLDKLIEKEDEGDD